MKNWVELISSGLLELYVFGETSPQENEMIEEMAQRHEEVRREMDEIGLAMEKYALANAVTPDPIVKPFLMAVIDYTDRMKAGAPFAVAPVLNENSVIADYAEWLNRPDMVLPDDFEDVYAKIVSYTPELITAILWIEHLAPQEVHDKEYEKFLIVEGTCTICVEEDKFPLKPGDYFTIPLHKNHHVLVTSDVPCKVVLQRVAA